MNKDSQLSWVIKRLKSGRTLTSLDALKENGIMRLAARIFELREKGLSVRSKTIKLSNGKQITEYRKAGKWQA